MNKIKLDSNKRICENCHFWEPVLWWDLLSEARGETGTCRALPQSVNTGREHTCGLFRQKGI